MTGTFMYYVKNALSNGGIRKFNSDRGCQRCSGWMRENGSTVHFRDAEGRN